MRENRTGRGTPSNQFAVCEQCRDDFVPKRQTKGRFCSAECYQTWWRSNGQREYSKRGLDRLEELRSEGRIRERPHRPLGSGRWRSAIPRSS
jgi:hypothetical protein